MRKIVAGTAAGILGIGLSLSFCGVARADVVDDPGDTAGGISEPNTWPTEYESEPDRAQEQAEAKADLSLAVFAAGVGGAAQARGSASVADLIANYQKTYGVSALSEADEAALLDASEPNGASSSGRLAAAAIDAPEKVLSMAQYDQAENYYCGPAAAQQLLKYEKIQNSKTDGVSLTQKNLAGSKYLQTDEFGETSWANGRMKPTLNRWEDATFYVNAPSPSADEFQAHVYSGVYLESPGLVDAVEFAGDAHYNNHPSSKTIGHWTSIYGYTENVVSTKFVDPSASPNVSWGDLPNDKFNYNTKNFANNFLQSNGMVW